MVSVVDPGQEATYVDAIKAAMYHAMRDDESVFLLGEDIADYGGAFKATDGFVKEFGEWRVVDTPIAESAILGGAMGAALTGLRPIAEMQFSDFVTSGFNQLVNNIATSNYRWGGAVPMVVRLPTGGGFAGGPFHSQNLEAFFTHTPGLKVVQPSNVSDAYGLLRSAIEDNDCVLFFEHKFLYRRIKGSMPDPSLRVPLGSGRLVKEGSNATIVTYGSMVHRGLEAIQRLEDSSDVSIELVDLRSLVPLDTEIIYRSVEKTSRVLILHEATLTSGFGGELSARLSEHMFEYLDAPIMRLASLDTPVPYSPPLEAAFMPQVDDIEAKLKQLLAY